MYSIVSMTKEQIKKMAAKNKKAVALFISDQLILGGLVTLTFYLSLHSIDVDASMDWLQMYAGITATLAVIMCIRAILRHRRKSHGYIESAESMEARYGARLHEAVMTLTFLFLLLSAAAIYVFAVRIYSMFT